MRDYGTDRQVPLPAEAIQIEGDHKVGNPHSDIEGKPYPKDRDMFQKDGGQGYAFVPLREPIHFIYVDI